MLGNSFTASGSRDVIGRPELFVRSFEFLLFLQFYFFYSVASYCPYPVRNIFRFDEDYVLFSCDV